MLGALRVMRAPVAGTYDSEVLADSPVGYWRLGESVGTTAADASGNGRDGTYAASGVTYGVTNSALVSSADTAVTLNGSTGKVTVTDNAAWEIAGDRTLEYFVKRTGTGVQIHLQQYDGSNGFRVYDDGATNLTVDQFTGAGRSYWQKSWASLGIDTTSWFHVAIVRVGGHPTNLTIYVNGTAYTSGNIAGTSDQAAATADLLFGTDGSNWFSGSLDEVAIYNSALAEARIQAHYDAR